MKPQKRPRRADGKTRHLLTKIFQTCQRARDVLYFVKYNQITIDIYWLVEIEADLLDDPPRIEITFKNSLQIFVLLKIEVMRNRKGGLPKLLKRISFTRLPNAL